MVIRKLLDEVFKQSFYIVDRSEIHRKKYSDFRDEK